MRKKIIHGTNIYENSNVGKNRQYKFKFKKRI